MAFQGRLDSSSESFEYDALSRVVTHNNPLGSFTQTYLGETGQLTGLQYSNGLVGTTWSYDDNTHDRHLLGIQNSGSTRSYNYETTAANLISQIHEISTGNSARPSKDWNYGYDAANRLETVQASDGAQYSYEFDAGDNLTAIVRPTGTTDFIVNSLNQVTDANGIAYGYDANGNLKDDGIRTYQWDADNRLLQIGYKAQPTRSTQFRYDGLGRRVAIISKNGAITTEYRYLWCGASLCQSRTATDVVARRYYAEGELRPQGNTLLYYSRDHLGSVRDVLNVPNGGRIASFDYDADGKATQTAGRLSTDFRYAGIFYLQEAGLYLTQYRAYDPNTGRWLSRDPIGELGGINLYGYVGGNPVNHTDSSGLFIDTIADAGFILYDLYKLASEGGCEQNTNLTALGLDIVGAITPGVTGLGTASRVTNTVGLNPIIIGENMKRVIEYADKVGGHAYRPIKNEPFNFDLGMKRNEAWIKAQIKNGREVIDINPDFQRRAATGRSSQFYEMERRNLDGYSNYKKAFERNDNQVGVPGLDF